MHRRSSNAVKPVTMNSGGIGNGGNSPSNGGSGASTPKRTPLDRLRDFNPITLLSGKETFNYERLPGFDSQTASPFTPLRKYRFPSPSRESLRFRRFSPTRAIVWAIAVCFVVVILVGGRKSYKQHEPLPEQIDDPELTRDPFPWEYFERLNGFYNGIRTLVPQSKFHSENPHNISETPGIPLQNSLTSYSADPPIDPVKVNPYPDYSSSTYLSEYHPVEECYLDENETIAAPDVFAYPGIPQAMTSQSFGSNEEMDINNVCYERFGRFSPYGYGYPRSQGGLELGMMSEQSGVRKVWSQMKQIDWREMDWGKAQEACYEKNKMRFLENSTSEASASYSLKKTPKKRVQRSAFILRSWQGCFYDDHYVMTMRAIINELALKSGGEFDVHLLVQVKDESIPVWASEQVYRQTLQEAVPQEFWSITTLWNEALMRTYYPDPFGEPFENDSQQPIHGVYRSAHMALQWFSQQHPEYDFYWNWEVDVRYTGHYYEFANQVGEWAKKQPRKGLWERSARYYIPAYHGSWQNFSEQVELESFERNRMPVWGPAEFAGKETSPRDPEEVKPSKSYFQDDYGWGVGEDADLITFNPLFNPNETRWVFKLDITGYNLGLPPPPRRCAIITLARLSKRLLDLMHEETFASRHSAFPEMWPPTVALHHGLKAAYAPHPVYFDRKWPTDYLNQVFNDWEFGDEPFGGQEHNQRPSSFYYNSHFSGALWRRWLGQRENNEGGTNEEVQGTGRMCLTPMLFHPIKFENGPED